MQAKTKIDAPETGNDTTVLCHICGKTEEIVFFDAMKNKWPRCHDEGMHLHETKADCQADLQKLTGLTYRNFSHTRRVADMKKEMEIRAKKKEKERR